MVLLTIIGVTFMQRGITDMINHVDQHDLDISTILAIIGVILIFIGY